MSEPPEKPSGSADGAGEGAKTHKPYVPAKTDLTDFSIRAVIMGCLFGALFGMANAYLGLRVGLTISTAIPLAVISVAAFRALEKLRIIRGSNILEHNISQTTGSASSSLASGLIFTIPALFIWGLRPPYFQLVVLGLLGSVLGILFMIPLRRFLIVKEHKVLPYPEGTAAAEVLMAADSGGARAKSVFTGLGIGALYKGLTGFLHTWPEKVYIPIFGLKKGYVGVEPTPALLGVGYILGYRISAIMVAGGLVSSVALIPLIAHFGDMLGVPVYPQTEKLISEMTHKQIWHSYIRYIGAGAVACAGIITVIRSFPTMVSALRIGVGEIRSGSAGKADAAVRTDRDLPFTVILVGVGFVVLAVVASPFVLGARVESLWVRAVGAGCITVFAFAFVTVSSRIVGMVGVSSNPTSGMTIVTLLFTSGIFYALGWTDMLGKAAALTVGTVVCVAASIAGDISQDLKCGYIIGATPSRQQTGEIVGGIFAALPVSAAVYLLGQAYGFGTEEIPAPQATLMKTVIEGVLSANLPWGLVLTGAAFAAVAELLKIPSLPFAVGMYLPLSTMTPVFVGGCLRALTERIRRKREVKVNEKGGRDEGLLFGSGLIAGEGLMGVAIAFYAFIAASRPKGLGIAWPSFTGELMSMVGLGILGFFLVRAALIGTKGKA